MLLLILLIFLSTPSVQTEIAKRVTTYVNDLYCTDIQIERLGLNWKGQVDIREVLIKDHHDDTLIYSQKVQTDFLNFRNLLNNKMGLGNTRLTNAKLYYKQYKGEERDNLSLFADKFQTGRPSSGSVFTLGTNNLELINGDVTILNENLKTAEVFNFSGINIAANDFKLTGPQVEAEILKLSLFSKRGLILNQLEGDFLYSIEGIVLNGLKLETAGSKVSGDISLFHGGKGFSDFYNDVIITADFENTKILTDDLNSFYNEFGLNQTIYLSGDIKGTLNNFSFLNGNINTGRTKIVGDFSFKNLLKKNRPYSIQLKNHKITTSYYELRDFMPRILGAVLPSEMKRLGTFSFMGTTVVTTSDLNTVSAIESDIGNMNANLTLGDFHDLENTSYKGSIAFTEFNLGKMTGTSSLGNVTADLVFDGSGFTQTTLNTGIDGAITSFSFEGYEYQNINISGTMKDPLFNGGLTVNDPNLKMDFVGLIDVSNDFNQYDFEANISFAELNKLNLVKRDSISVFAGKVVMDMDGTTFEDAEGSISLSETFYQNERDNFYFDDLKIISSFASKIRTIEVTSPDIINGEISGEFLLKDIPSLFRNGIASIYANFIPKEVTSNQYIDYEFVIYNKIVELFVPQLEFGENTRVKGSVFSDESKFKLNFKSPEILLFDNYLSKLNIQVDNDNPFFNTYVSIDSVYTGVYNLKDVSLINKTLNDTLYIRSEFNGGKKKEDLFNLSLYHTINPEGKSVVGVKKSDITYKENIWFLNEHNNRYNKVVFDDNFNTIRVDSLVLNHNKEIIHFAGTVRDSTYKNLRMRFNDVNIGNLIPTVDSLRLEGNLNGKFNLVQKNKRYYPSSVVRIDSLLINDITFGDFSLLVSGNEDLTRYSINSTLINDQVKSIEALGSIDVSKNSSNLDVDVALNEFNMRAFSPFGADVITDIRGLVSGKAKVTGDYGSPEIRGNFSLENSGLRVVEINTDFEIENRAEILVTKNKLEIGNVTITDSQFKTKGTFFGNATHENFSDWELNLHIEAPERLLVLNTPPDDEALYYGTAFISGSADISGPIDELVIDVTATTEEGTTFKIPLSDAETIGEDSFITFLSPKQKQAIISGVPFVSREIKGLSLNFDLDINNKAEVEVVVDKVNNSTLKGRGDGTLLIRINTLGKFQMWGEFTVIEGSYDFRYGGIIQKDIDVVGGGFIVWEGAPERARLNISAKYNLDANPATLLDNPSVNRDIPVEVIVDLKGEIIQPDLNFNIGFPKVSSTVRSELEYKLQSQEQNQKQALFLLATGSFVNDNYQSSNTFSGTLAQRVSGMVNDLFADEDGKFRVGLDYSAGNRTPNQETSDRLGITISTQISERLLINGKVGVPVGGSTDTTIAGDIEVQWLVNEDGSLRMKFFNREADLQFIGEDQTFEQGVGLTYSVNFDTFSELVNKLFHKKLTLESEEALPAVTDDNLPIQFVSPNNKKGI